MQLLPHTRACFVCGEANPLGLRMRFQTDGQVVRAEFEPCPHHVGFKHTIHGGIISTVLDEIMVWACAVQTKQFGFCAELTVRFLQPLRPDERYVATAELVSNRRDRVFAAKAQLQHPSNGIYATATGKYLPIKNTDREELLSELIGDVQLLRPAESPG